MFAQQLLLGGEHHVGGLLLHVLFDQRQRDSGQQAAEGLKPAEQRLVERREEPRHALNVEHVDELIDAAARRLRTERLVGHLHQRRLVGGGLHHAVELCLLPTFGRQLEFVRPGLQLAGEGESAGDERARHCGVSCPWSVVFCTVVFLRYSIRERGEIRAIFFACPGECGRRYLSGLRYAPTPTLPAAVNSPLPRLDSRIGISTPENIAFEYRVAGPWARLPAYLVDLLIRIVAVIVVWLVGMIFFSFLDLMAIGWFLGLLAWFLAQWFYGGLFEAYRNGQTPGKQVFGLRVLRIDGRPVTPIQAILRNLLQMVDMMPWAIVPGFFGELDLVFPTFLAALVPMMLTQRHQRLGDLVCGTMVVVEERIPVARLDAVDQEGLAQLMELLPANFQPSRSLARAVSHYMARRRYFGPARRQEIARHVGEVLAAKLNLPANINHDLLLSAVYARSFFGQSAELLTSKKIKKGDKGDELGIRDIDRMKNSGRGLARMEAD